MPQTKRLSPTEIAADLSSTLCSTSVTGAPLPSVRHLSAKYQTSRETVRRAIVMLERKGVVTTRKGIGTVVGRPMLESTPATDPSNLLHIEALSNRTAHVCMATCEWGSEKTAHWN